MIGSKKTVTNLSNGKRCRPTPHRLQNDLIGRFEAIQNRGTRMHPRGLCRLDLLPQSLNGRSTRLFTLRPSSKTVSDREHQEFFRDFYDGDGILIGRGFARTAMGKNPDLAIKAMFHEGPWHVLIKVHTRLA